MLTINLLQALPKTPLWDRLKRDGRSARRTIRRSRATCVFLRPYDEVVAMWRRCIAYANDPERLFARFRHQVDATYVNRKITPAQRQAQLGESVARRWCWRSASCCHIGILSDYRKPFWRAARHALRRGQIDAVFGMGFMRYHLIQFTREALRGEQNASYYSTKLRTASAAPATDLAAAAATRRSDGDARACSPDAETMG